MEKHKKQKKWIHFTIGVKKGVFAPPLDHRGDVIIGVKLY